MASKNIYIKDDDISVFDEAERLAEGNGESLSGVIAAQLRQYIEHKKMETNIVLEVGRWPAKGASDTSKVSFKGRLLAEGTKYDGQTASRDDRGIDWQIYQTAKGKILVYWRNWSCWQGEGDYADYVVVDRLPSPNDVFAGEANGDMVGNIPASIIEEAAEALGQDAVKRLDV